MFEAARVTEVWAEDASGGRLGSGYLVDERHVLTAGHVASRAAKGACEVRPLGRSAWQQAAVVWQGDGNDAALLRLTGSLFHDGGLVRFGRFATDEPAECRALGFPAAQEKPGIERTVRDTEDLLGEIRPLSSSKSGLLTVHVAGSVPPGDASGGSPWEGMSGSALFVGDLLVGVVTEAPAQFGTDRLEAVPSTALAANSTFCDALGLQKALPAVEDADVTRGLLRSPYRALPEQAKASLAAGAAAFLLEPAYGIVPFHQRGRALTALEEWCSDERKVAIGLLTGPGGSGKTRIAAELCRVQLAAGMTAGFLDPRGGKPVERLADVRSPLLVVIDEAHARAAEVGRLIGAVAAAPRHAPVRLLLVARQGGDWWPGAVRDSLPDDPDARLLFDTAGNLQRELGPLSEGPDDRLAAFSAAEAAFAQQLGTDFLATQPDLAGSLFESVLFIHLAAHTAASGRPDLLRQGVVANDLLSFALDREGRYWANTAKARGLDLEPRVLKHAVTVGTLTSASKLDEATRALTAVSDLSDASEGTLRRTARWLRSLYPRSVVAPSREEDPNGDVADEAWFRPLIPDLLGEALVASSLSDEDGADLATDLIGLSSRPSQLRRCLIVLTQAARHHESAYAGLERALADHMTDVWPAAVAVAQQSGDPIGTVLASTLERAPEPTLALAIAEAIPPETVALRELGVTATGLALEMTRSGEAGGIVDSERARLANNLSVRLAGLGRREEALAAIEEAISIRRELAAARPDAFLPDLASSLNNQSNRLADLGRREEALAAIDEAVSTYRALAATRPEGFLPDLASSLNNQSNRLADLGRHEEALAAIDEAVSTYRGLAAARPDAFQPNLAASLNNQSNWLAGLGRREEALAAIEEAVSIRRELAAARPDGFLPDLATSLNNQSNRLADLGRREEALVAIEEAVSTYRALAATRPEAFLPGLAMALNNQSGRLADLGRREEALAAIDEAVNIYRGLAVAHPQAFLPNLADSLNNQSNWRADLGRREEALAAIDEAVNIRRELAAARPDAFLPNLATSLNNQSNRLAKLGRREEALAAIEEAVDIRRGLASGRPDAFLSDLAGSLNNQSNRLADLGRREDALAAIEEAVSTYRALAATRPAAFLPDLANSLNSQSGRLAALGHCDEALAAIEEAVNIRRELAAARPDAFLSGLASSLNNQSNRLAGLGRREEALAAAEEAVSTYRALAAARPDAFLPDLAISLTNQAVRLREFNRPEAAVRPVEEAITLIAPALERAPYVLPDSGLLMVQTYLAVCEQRKVEPRKELVERMRSVLRATGADASFG